MRPVTKPELDLDAFEFDPAVLLLQSLGEYCSFSEQPLSAENYVWDKRNGEVVVAPITPDRWEHVLLLSEECYQAQLYRAPESLLLPDEFPLTFSLREEPAFAYRLVPGLLWRYTNDNGEPDGEEKKDTVIVEANEKATAVKEAATTIRFFDLNTRYFIEKNREQEAYMRIPRSDELQGKLRFIEQRTAVWHAALELPALFKETEAAEINNEAIFAHVRRRIAAMGHWSVWATVMKQEGLAEILPELLLPLDPESWERGAGSLRAFPGTNQLSLLEESD